MHLKHTKKRKRIMGGGVPKTGQTTVYLEGDDGTYQKGLPVAGERFTDNGDGTITDNVTGLMWPKDGAGPGCNNGVKISWSAAIAWAEDLNFAGYDDWRLPNINELLSLFDFGKANPMLDTAYFPNTVNDYYYSSTTKADNDTYAWVANYFNGYAQAYGTKTYNRGVRAVRGG